MRKLLLISALIFAYTFANAQEGLKGTWFTGGALTLSSLDAGFNGSKSDADTYSVMPLIGKFISPSVAVGGAIGYTHTKVGDLKTNTFSVMPLVRKYWNVSGKLYFFGQAALPFDFSNIKNGADGFGLALSLSPGFDLIVTDWLTVETSFTLISAGYSQISPDEGDSVSAWSINGNSISSSEFGKLTVGVKFLF